MAHRAGRPDSGGHDVLWIITHDASVAVRNNNRIRSRRSAFIANLIVSDRVLETRHQILQDSCLPALARRGKQVLRESKQRNGGHQWRVETATRWREHERSAVCQGAGRPTRCLRTMSSHCALMPRSASLLAAPRSSFTQPILPPRAVSSRADRPPWPVPKREIQGRLKKRAPAGARPALVRRQGGRLVHRRVHAQERLRGVLSRGCQHARGRLWKGTARGG